MAAAGHTATDLADFLSVSHGVTCGQSTVSRWLSGQIAHPRCAPQLHAYIEAFAPPPEASRSHRDASIHDPQTPTSAAPPRPLRGSEGSNEPTASANDHLATEFGALAGRAADEPLIGPAQSELVEALNRRLASGPPLSEWDFRAYALQAQVLRLVSSVD